MSAQGNALAGNIIGGLIGGIGDALPKEEKTMIARTTNNTLYGSSRNATSYNLQESSRLSNFMKIGGGVLSGNYGMMSQGFKGLTSQDVSNKRKDAYQNSTLSNSKMSSYGKSITDLISKFLGRDPGTLGSLDKFNEIMDSGFSFTPDATGRGIGRRSLIDQGYGFNFND